MALNLEGKKVVVSEVNAVAQGALSLVVAEYRGLSVPAMTALRKKAREQGVYLRVIRNTLAKRALEGTSLACLEHVLVGPLVFGFAQNDPGAAARVFRDFAKENELLRVKALAVSGRAYEAHQLEAVASLPTREEALSKCASTLLAPITQLARILKEPYAGLVRALADYRSKKDAKE